MLFGVVAFGALIAVMAASFMRLGAVRESDGEDVVEARRETFADATALLPPTAI